jgi:small subunit ribosomal protein S19
MPRSLKKGPYVDQKLLKKVLKLKAEKKEEPIKTWSRDCTIIPEFVGFTFLVHDGKNFIPVKVREEMVGHKLGEFAPTTKFFRHGGKMQRELEKKAAEKEAEKIKTEMKEKEKKE